MDAKVNGKGKAILIDGQSANRMKAALGIRLVDYRGLYQVLYEKIGSYRSLACMPAVTVHPEQLLRVNFLNKHLAGAGFEVLPVASEGSADDKEIMRRIELLDPRTVAEIVLVTSDQDFIPVVREKASQGISIYWVSTRKPDPRCGQRLSQRVLDLATTNVIHFVELANFAQEITLQRDAPCKRTQGFTPNDDNTTVITIRLRSNRPAEHHRLVSEITNLKAHFKGMEFEITG